MYTRESVSSVENFISAYELMKSLNKTETHFLTCNVFFVYNGNLFWHLFYYIVAGISAVWRP